MIDLRLEALRSTLEDLPEVTKDWPSMDSVERDSWVMDWNQVVGAYLAEVDAAKRGGPAIPIPRGACRKTHGSTGSP